MKGSLSTAVRIAQTASASLAALLVVSCATIESGAHFDETADFGSYRTFAWIDDEPLIVGADDTGIVISPLTRAKVQRTLRAGFERRGYEFLDNAEEADFVIAYTIGTRQELSVRSYPVEYRGAWGWHVRGSNYYINEYVTHSYTRGTLGVDVFDRRTKKPVWHGFAEKTITDDDKSDPSLAIEAGVRAMLESFPKWLGPAGENTARTETLAPLFD